MAIDYQLKMRTKDIILDPTTTLQMSTYYEKIACSQQEPCATFGLLYAQQAQLKYKMCWAVPIGDHRTSETELRHRASEYEGLRLKRSKTTVNFYEQYTLVGCYIMRPVSEKQQDEKVVAVAYDLHSRGAPFYMIADPEDPLPTVFKIEGKKQTRVHYTTEMDQAEKLCIDSMYHQNSKESSAITKCVERQQNMMEVLQAKIEQLQKRITDQNASERQKRQILEALEDYDRLVAENAGRKKQTVDAMNYSVMVGIQLNQYMSKSHFRG